MKNAKDKKPVKVHSTRKFQLTAQKSASDDLLQKISNRFLHQYPHRSHLIKRSPHAALILLLIREDLKSRKFFDGLRTAGLDDVFYQPDLSMIILAYTGFIWETNKDYDFYYHLLGKHSKKINDTHSLTEQAFKVYRKLTIENQKRSVSNSL